MLSTRTRVVRRTRLTRRGEYALAALCTVAFFATPVIVSALFRWWLL